MSSQAFVHRSGALKRETPRVGVAARVGAVLGVVAVFSFLVDFALGGDEPAADASAPDAVAYWTSHHDKQMVAIAILAFSAPALIGFGVILRDALRAAEEGREELARVAFAGLVIAAAGILTNLGITFAAADTAGTVSPQVTQTLSALSVDFGIPIAAGFGLFMFASGGVVSCSGIIPRWLGWLAALVGVAAFTPAAIVAFWGLPVWILILSARLYLHGDAATSKA